MKLIFLYYPVSNLEESVTFYREQQGFVEAWREGDHTVAMSLPDSDVKLLLEEDEKDLSPGGVFLVENVDHFYDKNKDSVEFIKLPVDIPPGRYAIYQDNSGNLIRIIDFTKEN